jgi:hypothetical protein
MKRLLLTMLAALALYSCADNTKEEKNLVNDILKVHDQVMANDEMLMKNKMKLDTLLKQKIDTDAVKMLEAKLAAADAAMEKWMNGFQLDMTGKSHDEVMKYYTDQKKQVAAVDSQVNVAIKEADKYLSNHKIK